MTVFSKIISGEIPSYKIREDGKFFAFLDIMPLREGHVLVVPKVVRDKFFDMDDDYLSELLVFAKPIAFGDRPRSAACPPPPDSHQQRQRPQLQPGQADRFGRPTESHTPKDFGGVVVWALTSSNKSRCLLNGLMQD